MAILTLTGRGIFKPKGRVAAVSKDEHALPAGYDLGVLHSLRDLGRILDRGIDEIEAETEFVVGPGQ